MTSTRTPGARTRAAILAVFTLILTFALTAVTPTQPASARLVKVCARISVTQACTWVEVPPKTTKPPRTKPTDKPPTDGPPGSNYTSYCTDGTGCDDWWPWSKKHIYWFPARAPSTLVAIGSSVQTGMVATYPSKCDALAKDGGDARTGGKKYLGVETSQSGVQKLRNARILLSRQDHASYRCIERPHYTDDPRDCAATTGATLVGPMENPDVASKTTSFGPAKSPFARSGYKALSLCDDAFVQPFPVQRNTMGKYRLTGTGRQITCTIRHYTTQNAKTGRVPRDEIKSCANERRHMRDEVKWQLYCGGWDLFWDDKHTFSQDECRDQGPWTCGPNVNKVPKFNGVSVPAAGIGVLDDGNERAATWNLPKPVGALTGVGAKRATLDVDPHSTPYRTGEDVNGPTQPFMATPNLNSELTGWDTTWKIRFQAASLSPRADGTTTNQWVAVPTWMFTAKFKTVTFTNIIVDWRTGAITPTKPHSVWVPASATCVGKPLTLSVYRAHNVR